MDIGFGQGLSLLNAARMGARASGLDVNPLCGEVIRNNRRHYPELDGVDIPLQIGSILDPAIVHRLRAASPGGNGYGVVHSWGVLHHTGDMDTAIRHAASLVAPGGVFIIALYNAHWSNWGWLGIKAAYNRFPLLRLPLVWMLFPVIGLAKFAVTRTNPFRKERGMNFYYDVVDWVGGYPYEWEDADSTRLRMKRLGFSEIRFTPPPTPTGCNEFVFKRA